MQERQQGHQRQLCRKPRLESLTHEYETRAACYGNKSGGRHQDEIGVANHALQTEQFPVIGNFRPLEIKPRQPHQSGHPDCYCGNVNEFQDCDQMAFPAPSSAIPINPREPDRFRSINATTRKTAATAPYFTTPSRKHSTGNVTRATSLTFARQKTGVNSSPSSGLERLSGVGGEHSGRRRVTHVRTVVKLSSTR